MAKTPAEVPTKDLDEAWGRFEPEEPLQPDSPWWVDCHEARGGPDLVRRVIRRTTAASKAGKFVHDLFTGHRGCGKSTELNRVADALEKHGFFVLSFSALEYIDPLNVEFGDVLVAVARHVVETLARKKIKLRKALLDEIYNWFAERVESQANISKSDIELSAGAELKGLPMLVKLFAGFNSAIRMGEEKRTELRRVVQEHLGLLVSRLNDLFRDARSALRKAGYQDLVIIMDNLDRIDPAPRAELGGRSQHDVLICDYGRQLVSLDCHTIYTVSVGLVLSPQAAELGAIYQETYHLPMIKVQTRNGGVFGLGCSTLKDIVARRASQGLFGAGVLHRLCVQSGGNPRDLVRLVRRAIEYTDEPPVGKEAAESACQELTNEFRWLNDDQLRLLAELNRRADRALAMTDEEKLLLSTRAILGYGNGDEWYAVHPAIAEMQRFQKMSEESDD